MADVNFVRRTAAQTGRAEGVQVAREDVDAALFELIELLFFAYRDFTGDPDAILEEIGFGRAHHRVLHFVSRNPGLRVADLLDILKITKQSLGRVLKQLVDEGYVYQKPGPSDRRQRLLYPTRRGEELALALARPQARRIADALAAGQPGDAEAAARFLMNLVNEPERRRVAALLAGGQGDGRAGSRPE